jgi:hypothetical protein
MNPHNQSTQTLWIMIAACLIVSLPVLAYPQTATHSGASATPAGPPLGGDPWPRKTTFQGAKISIYQPQLQSWTGNVLDAYAAVTIKTPGSNATNYGVIWFAARTEIDKVNRVVTLANFSLTKQNFPTLAANGAAYSGAFRGGTAWSQMMPLDELETSLTTTSIADEQQKVAVINDPPRIIFSTAPAILVLIDGQPKLGPSLGGLQKVINTRALVVFDPSTSLYYLALMDGWAQSSSLVEGQWSEAKAKAVPLDQIKRASLQNKQNQVLGNPDQSLKEAYADGESPAVYISTTPAELLLSHGEPALQPIPPTDLQYVSNTGDDIFQESDNQQYYVLIAGRWFAAPSLQAGPWTYVSGGRLPADFSRIPDYSPKASVLVSGPCLGQSTEIVNRQCHPAPERGDDENWCV